MARVKSNEVPYSLEAEEYVLGSILIEPELANEYCGNINSDDFYFDKNKKIYLCIEHLFKLRKETNVINVIETLKTFGFYEAINEKYLYELTDSVPTIVTTESYVEILKERSIERELYNKTKEIASKVLEGDIETSDLLAFAEKTIVDVVNKQRTGELRKIGYSVGNVFDKINESSKKTNKSVTGLDTGYSKLNEYTFGFQKGELIILAARPSVGKSALALNIGYKASKFSSKNVAFFSLEMGIDQLIIRLLSSAGNVKLSNLRNGNLNVEDSAKILNARVDLDNLNFYIDESTNNSLEDIKIKCRKMKRENKLDFIIIDYMQLLSLSKGKQRLSRYEEVSSISRNLKLLALELDIPILALSQLSRSVEQRNKMDSGDKQSNSMKKPVLSDLRESGSIEQDADIVLFLHRDKDSEDPSSRLSSHKVELIVAKNRQGMTGSFDLIFRADCSSFENFSDKKQNKQENL